MHGTRGEKALKKDTAQKAVVAIDPECAGNGDTLTTEGALSFHDFKKALGTAAAKYNDEQIERMRVICDRIADAHFDGWLKRLNAHNVTEAKGLTNP